MSKEELKIVAVKDIPLGETVLLDNLISIYAICQKLEILCDKEKGLGISAVQAGIPLNLFIIKNKKEFDYYINCDYTVAVEEKNSIIMYSILEGCLSLRDKDNQLRYFNVQRYSKVFVSGHKMFLENNQLVLATLDNQLFKGFDAVIMQHEIDHNFGILISDIGTEVDIHNRIT